MVDPTCNAIGALLGDASEHLYQLNHVHVALPTKGADIKTSDDRLFARFEVWGQSKKCTPAFRGKAMLQLASIPEGEDQ